MSSEEQTGGGGMPGRAQTGGGGMPEVEAE
jgi:hypothetical protein